MSPELSRLPKVPTSPRQLGELAQLLFEWPIRQAPRLTLPLCILLAAVAQTAIVVIFSISYEAPSAKLALAPRFYFLPPDSASARQLGAWLDGNDPALFAPGRATASALPPPPPLKYRPSYEEPPPPLLPLPEIGGQQMEPPLPPFPFSPSMIPGTESGGVLRKSPPSTASVAPHGMSAVAAGAAPVVRWLDELETRRPVGTGGTPPSPLPRMAATKPSLYQVSVGTEGIPMHCILTDSSGNAEADEAGRIWIISCRFQPAGTPSWGRVLIPWEASVPNFQATATSKPAPKP
ncbi:MAG: hypothetical protein RLZZ408_1091 [Verrucomicrobiota bacterium]